MCEYIIYRESFQSGVTTHLVQDNIKKMLEKADKLGRHGVSTGTIKSFFNAHSEDQFNAAMKQLDGKTRGLLHSNM